MPLADRHGLPIAARIAGASPDEPQLAEAALRPRFMAATPQRMIVDRAHDREPPAGLLANGTGLIVLYKNDRTRTKPQEGCELCRS
jgi:hypothetical protein